MTYELKIINGKLVMLRPRFITGLMTPIFKDHFQVSNENSDMNLPFGVNFIIDAKGTITGFKVSTCIVTNRVRNLYFEKIN